MLTHSMPTSTRRANKARPSWSIFMQFIEIGPVPGEEHCAQVGSPDYTEASLRECEVFRRMLYRLFPVPEKYSTMFLLLSSVSVSESP